MDKSYFEFKSVWTSDILNHIEDSEVTYKCNFDLDIYQITEHFKKFLLSTGYVEQTVNKIQVVEG